MIYSAICHVVELLLNADEFALMGCKIANPFVFKAALQMPLNRVTNRTSSLN